MSLTLGELRLTCGAGFPPRFNDIHVPIRLECVKFASHCLMNHPDLAKDLTGKPLLQTHARTDREGYHDVG